MVVDFSLFFLGILGFLVLYIVLIHLSTRMGEGMGLPKYYLLYYIAILALILTIPVGWSIYYAEKENSQETLFILLLIGNIVAIAASFKYWWWLKDEILVRKVNK